jgi:hypothetical protein
MNSVSLKNRPDLAEKVLARLLYHRCVMVKHQDHWHWNVNGRLAPLLDANDGLFSLIATYYGDDPTVLGFENWNWATVFATPGAEISLKPMKSNIIKELIQDLD